MKTQYYDEVTSPEGQIRDHYKGVYDHWGSLKSEKIETFREKSKMMFSGDYILDPVPRILTYSEYEFLQRGVKQRAKAILAFIEDYYKKGTKWGRVLPANLLEEIVTRHHEKNLLRELDPRILAFQYGPDVIRDRHGQWRIIEDSSGILGGIGDLVRGRRILFRLMPEYRKAVGDCHDPLDFFKELAGYYSKKAAQYGGMPVLYLRSFKRESDQETKRLAEIYSGLGIETATASDRHKKLEFEGHGGSGRIYLRIKGRKKRVGAIILHADPHQFDGLKFARNKKRKNKNDYALTFHFLQAFARSTESLTLEESLLQGHTWTNFSPGIQFVNDKMFGVHVDSMIQMFLKESPILTSLPTRPVAFRSRTGWKLDKRALDQIRRNKDQYVLKKVDEDGGSGVWIGHREPRRIINGLIDEIKESPGRYIVQKFEHLSVLENRIVDLRIHAHVDYERIIVSNTPWGRACWLNGDGKVNIGANGFTSPVVVIHGKNCDK